MFELLIKMINCKIKCDTRIKLNNPQLKVENQKLMIF